MPRAILVCLTIVAAFSVRLGAENVVTEDVPVPGGIAAIAEALGLPTTPDRARFIAEIARLAYPAAEGTQTTRAKAVLALGRNKGKDPVPVVSPSDTVPIPLTVAFWSRAVFHRSIRPEEAVTAIISDPRSAHLCHGLAASDDETLLFFAGHPDLIGWLHDNAAAVFAAFGGSVHIRENRVIPPGGPSAAVLWETVVGEKLSRPEAFVRALFSQDQGRLAYLYDTIADLDSARAAFALGLWMKDATVRVDRFKALAAANRAAFAQWQPSRFPFSRPLDDVAAMLSRVRAEPDGSPSFPAMRSAWAWAFESTDVPLDAVRLPNKLQDDGVIDAAWLAEAIASDDADVRSDRLDQLSFGQRAFSTPDAGALADVFVAVRGLPRFRMLMLVLERIGIRQASSYATALRRARQLNPLDGRRGLVANAQFQGALALIARMAAVQTLDVATAEALVLSLSNVALNSDGRYAGAVAIWTRRQLGAALLSPSLGLRRDSDDMESVLAAALAGARTAESPVPSRIPWEGQFYRLDMAAAEEQRLRRIREKQASPSIDVGLTLAETVKTITSGGHAAEVGAAISALKQTVQDLPSGPDGASHREVVHRAIEDLSKAATAPDTSRVGRTVAPLLEVADQLLADALMNWAYAVSIADADSPVLLGGNVTRWHDFGLNPGPRRLRQSTEWALPRQQVAVGSPWHVVGSLLGLDVALSPLALRRVDGNRVVDAPTLSTNERAAFAAALALLDPYRLRDEERDVIAEAIARGRVRVGTVAEDSSALPSLMDEVRMDGWRRRALQWMMSREPDGIGSMFSLTELLYLGAPSNVDLNAWGMSALATSGCLCTRLAPPNQWRTLLGRPQLGLMAATVPDLNLHVAMVLRDLHLPSAILKSVLAAAVQDFIDEARPTDANDWLTLVRAARTVPRERIEDYVASATADGPLVPDELTEAAR
jgi:hypothetical protein